VLLFWASLSAARGREIRAITTTGAVDNGDRSDEEPPHALLERRGGVLIVTMNRPAARNPLIAAVEGAANGPLAVRTILRVIRETEGMAENEAFVVEAKAGLAVFASEGAKEGPRAFAEKRRPPFRDG
jgi:enoyl-CoA hydratase/carnithine racemase